MGITILAGIALAIILWNPCVGVFLAKIMATIFMSFYIILAYVTKE